MKPCLPKWAAIRLPCATQDISISFPCHPSILDIITYVVSIYITFDTSWALLGLISMFLYIHVSCDIMRYHVISRLMISHDIAWYYMISQFVFRGLGLCLGDMISYDIIWYHAISCRVPRWWTQGRGPWTRVLTHVFGSWVNTSVNTCVNKWESDSDSDESDDEEDLKELMAWAL